MAAAANKPGAGELRRFPAAWLLVALVLLFVGTPLIEDWPDGDLVESSLVTLVLVMAVLTVGARRRTLAIATVLVAPAIAGRWLNHVRPDLVPLWSSLLMGLVFITFVVASLLRFILRARQVDTSVLYVGITIYLMLGMIWAFAYLLVAQFDPNAFSFSPELSPRQTMKSFNSLYFSFSTLSTAGYGDITPGSNVARMLAVLEMITGVLYVAVLISRLVALLHASPNPSAEPREAAPPGGPDDAP